VLCKRAFSIEQTPANLPGSAAAGLVLTLTMVNLPGHAVVDGNGRPEIFLRGYPQAWTFSEPVPPVNTPEVTQDIVETFLPHSWLPFVYDWFVWSSLAALLFVTGTMAARLARRRGAPAETSA
jgi:hypothetical protein